MTNALLPSSFAELMGGRPCQICSAQQDWGVLGEDLAGEELEGAPLVGVQRPRRRWGGRVGDAAHLGGHLGQGIGGHGTATVIDCPGWCEPARQLV